MSDQTLRVLKAARGYLATGWCAQHRGQDSHGNGCYGNDPRAVRWCALGAIDKALGCDVVADGSAAACLLASLVPQVFRQASVNNTIAYYNNNHDQATVLAWFDRAIAQLEPSFAAGLMEKIMSTPLEGEKVVEHA